MLEIMARQSRSAAKLPFLHQLARTLVVVGEVERIAGLETAGNAMGGNQLGKPRDTGSAAAIDAGRPLEAIKGLQLTERAVDLPLQHRRACRGAAEPGLFAVDDDHREAARRQMFGGKRAGDTAADNGDIGLEALLQRLIDRLHAVPAPERAAAHELVVAGFVEMQVGCHRLVSRRSRYFGSCGCGFSSISSSSMMVMTTSDSGRASMAPTAPHIHVQKMIARKTTKGLISSRRPMTAGKIRFSMTRCTVKNAAAGIRPMTMPSWDMTPAMATAKVIIVMPR